MKLGYDEVMARADFLYSEMREAEGRPQVYRHGIESSQIKAICKALVEAVNEALPAAPGEKK